jgi:hypothetical protein
MSRKPKPCWIDGELFRTTSLAADELGVSGSYMGRILAAGVHAGRQVTRCAPSEDFSSSFWTPRIQRAAVPLLSAERCRHRLGVYHGGQV